MRLSIATPKAVRYACMNFHYAKAVPVCKYGFNVFNDKGEWCGVIIYGTGANNHIADPFGLYQGEVLELVRVALNGKQETTSQCLAMSIRELHKIAPQVKIIVSYADCDQNHAGIIYQATNWLYLGKMNENQIGAYIVNGKKTHPKSLYEKGYKQNIDWLRKNVDSKAEVFYTTGKHKYIYVFDKKLRKKYKGQCKEYPKNERKAREQNE